MGTGEDISKSEEKFKPAFIPLEERGDTPLFTDPDIAHTVAELQKFDTERAMEHRKAPDIVGAPEGLHDRVADELEAKQAVQTAELKSAHDQILANRQAEADSLGENPPLFTDPDLAQSVAEKQKYQTESIIDLKAAGIDTAKREAGLAAATARSKDFHDESLAIQRSDAEDKIIHEAAARAREINKSSKAA